MKTMKKDVARKGPHRLKGWRGRAHRDLIAAGVYVLVERIGTDAENWRIYSTSTGKLIGTYNTTSRLWYQGGESPRKLRNINELTNIIRKGNRHDENR